MESESARGNTESVVLLVSGQSEVRVDRVCQVVSDVRTVLFIPNHYTVSVTVLLIPNQIMTVSYSVVQ